jgi:hypothetical protein
MSAIRKTSQPPIAPPNIPSVIAQAIICIRKSISYPFNLGIHRYIDQVERHATHVTVARTRPAATNVSLSMIVNICLSAAMLRPLSTIYTLTSSYCAVKGNISRFPDGILLAIPDGTFGAAARRFRTAIRETLRPYA